MFVYLQCQDLLLRSHDSFMSDKHISDLFVDDHAIRYAKWCGHESSEREHNDQANRCQVSVKSTAVHLSPYTRTTGGAFDK